MAELIAVPFSTRDTDSLFVRLMESAGKERRENAAKYRFRDDGVRTLLGDALVRVMLAERLGVVCSEWRFGRMAQGKPFLPDYPDVHFNVSHSGEWVAAAMGETSVGVDVEQVRSIDLSIGERVFAPEEYEQLLAKRETDRLFYFYELWTAKESVIKADGRGLAMPLRSFRMREEGPSHWKAYDAFGDLLGFSVKRLPIDPGYRLALCEQRDTDMRCDFQIRPVSWLLHRLNRLLEGELP